MTSDEFRHSFKGSKYNLGLAVYSCGIQRCAPNHSWWPAIRDHYLIHYIVSGHGTFFAEGKSWRLSAGQVFLVKPNIIASYRADSDFPWEYCWVGFNGSDAPHLMEQTGLLSGGPVFDCGKENSCKDLIMKIISVSGSGDSNEAKMESCLLWFLSYLMDHFGKKADTCESGFHYVQKAMRFIDRSYSMPIGIGQIAASAEISRSHLYRLFVQYLKMPPNEYLTHYRLQKALFFLKEKKLSVGEAAYSAGFSDPLYFSRVFKKHMGFPPSQYIKNPIIVEEES